MGTELKATDVSCSFLFWCWGVNSPPSTGSHYLPSLSHFAIKTMKSGNSGSKPLKSGANPNPFLLCGLRLESGLTGFT